MVPYPESLFVTLTMLLLIAWRGRSLAGVAIATALLGLTRPQGLFVLPAAALVWCLDLPIRDVMTADPVALTPDALGSDILHIMLERRIGHLPVVEAGQLVGMVTQTDLTRFQAVSSAVLGFMASYFDGALMIIIKGDLAQPAVIRADFHFGLDSKQMAAAGEVFFSP